MRELKFSFLLLISLQFFSACNSEAPAEMSHKPEQYIVVLGVAQDAGFPQMNCEKECCRAFYEQTETKKLISCLGLVDQETEQKWMFDATPDITQQVENLKQDHIDNGNVIDGIFLTHAHIGHYTGLMYLGFEVIGGKDIPVYAMPGMKTYLEGNGPWSQLVSMKNIEVRKMRADSSMALNNSLKVTPFIVPHRDEYSETVGYKIEGNNKSALFIPDINKWGFWERNIVEEVKKVDYAFIDATFFKDGEIPRPMADIPHPFIVETAKLFEAASVETKSKVYFIHLNHTNPALKSSHVLKDSILNLGFNFAKQGAIYDL